jgi:hypothetical protein
MDLTKAQRHHRTPVIHGVNAYQGEGKGIAPALVMPDAPRVDTHFGFGWGKIKNLMIAAVLSLAVGCAMVPQTPSMPSWRQESAELTQRLEKMSTAGEIRSLKLHQGCSADSATVLVGPSDQATIGLALALSHGLDGAHHVQLTQGASFGSVSANVCD